MVTTRSMCADFSTGAWSPRRSRRSRRLLPPSPPPPPWFCPPKPPPRRCGPAIRGSFPSRFQKAERKCSSQLQPCFPCAVGHRGHAAVVLVAAAVEHDRADALGLGPLGDELADFLGLGGLVAVGRAQARLHGGGRGQRHAGDVVHDLRHHVARGAGDHQARAQCRAGDLLADAQVAALDGVALLGRTLADLDCESHYFFPAFPALRRMTSPANLMPLPLYGSILRSFLM